MKGRLNLFQASMLRWRALHPYNAVHVVGIEKPQDESRLAAAIDAELTAAGLTGLVLDSAHLRYEYRGGPAKFALTMIADDGDGERTLCSEIERQLNLPFPPDGPLEPLRFFALRTPAGFRLGLAYDHFIAGGDSIVLLLKGIVARYGGAPREGPYPGLYPPTLAAVFMRNFGKLAAGLPSLARIAASSSRGVLPRYADDADGHNGFRYVRVDAPALATLLARTKAWSVTFNDLMLAVLLRALSSQWPDRDPSRRRSEIALASVVNLRGETGADVRAMFGQFLSSIRVSHPVPADVTLEQLARDVHHETARVKAGKLYLQTLLVVHVNGFIWRFLDTRRRHRVYAKAFPVLAGLTTLNVNALWNPRGVEEVPRDYLRAVPTGPLAPLLVAVTSCGNALQLGLSYRRSARIAPIDQIAESITTCLRSLE